MNDDVNELEASNREKLKNFAYLYDSIEKWGKAALQARIDRLNEDLKNTKLTDNEKLALEKALSETTQALSEKAPLAAMRELDKRIVAAKKKIASANGDANKIKEAQRDIDESTSKKSEIDRLKPAVARVGHGDDDGAEAGGLGRQNGPSHGIERCAGGHDVIDDDDMPAGQGSRPA